MAKNRLNIQNPKALLAEMFVLVMGDEDEDIDDVSFLVVYFQFSKTILNTFIFFRVAIGDLNWCP